MYAICMVHTMLRSANADGKVDASSAVGDFDLAPRAVHVEEDE